MKGPAQLLDSKKGTVFSVTATAITAIATAGGAAAMPASYLVAGLAGVYILGQSLVDQAKERNKKTDGKDPRTGL